MNVRELIDELENYGDHLEVVVVRTDTAGEESTYGTIDVDTQNILGDVQVVLAVED